MRGHTTNPNPNPSSSLLDATFRFACPPGEFFPIEFFPMHHPDANPERPSTRIDGNAQIGNRHGMRTAGIRQH